MTYGNSSYSALTVRGRTISFQVTTTGGCDTPQLYISYPSAATDAAVPTKVLRYFKKLCGSAMGSGAAAAASSHSLSFTLTDRDVSNWDAVNKQWSVTPGKYGVLVGSSSQDIRLTGTLTVAAY